MKLYITSKMCYDLIMGTGRPRKPWLIAFEEVRRRYEAGESVESLATACGLGGYGPITAALRAAGVRVRKPGGPKGPRPGHQSNKEVRTCKGLSCSNTFPAYPSSNKRYCSPECRYTSPELIKLLETNIKNRHILSSIDEQTRTAICNVCGPIDIRERGERRKYNGAHRTWRCRGAERARVWARQYGVDAATIMGMWEAQGRRCAICRTALGLKFAVDHCHETGRVRGLLCSTCNIGLGLFADNPERLRTAVGYLETADPLALGPGRSRGTVTSQKDEGQHRRRCGPPGSGNPGFRTS
jgi:hypothetical protein